MRNLMDFTPPEVYREMDEMAKYQRKMRVRLLFLDMIIFALGAAVFMATVVIIIDAIKATK